MKPLNYAGWILLLIAAALHYGVRPRFHDPIRALIQSEVVDYRKATKQWPKSLEELEQFAAKNGSDDGFTDQMHDSKIFAKFQPVGRNLQIDAASLKYGTCARFVVYEDGKFSSNMLP